MRPPYHLCRRRCRRILECLTTINAMESWETVHDKLNPIAEQLRQDGCRFFVPGPDREREG